MCCGVRLHFMSHLIRQMRLRQEWAQLAAPAIAGCCPNALWGAIFLLLEDE